MSEPVRLIFTSNQLRWSAFYLFNENAYPRGLESVLNASGVKLSLLAFHAARARRQESEDLHRFAAALSEQLKDESGANWIDATFIAQYHSVELIDALSSTLYYLKSFFDSFAHLICRLIAPGQSATAFGKANIDGQKLAGGALINFLQNQGEASRPHTLPVAEQIAENSRRWITEAVDLRDEFTHRNVPRGFLEMQTPLARTQPFFSRDTIQPSRLPNGEPVGEYCEACAVNTRTFVPQILALLPNIDTSFLSLDPEAWR